MESQRHSRERETERRYFDAGEELQLTLAGKSIFRFWFVTLQLNSIYCRSRISLFLDRVFYNTLAADSFICSAFFHFEAPPEEKSALLAKWGLGFTFSDRFLFQSIFFLVIRCVSLNSISHKCHSGVVFRTILFFSPTLKSSRY
ncbi:hypothetical protein VNO80_18965 [Phaseolus coccineus]|uniref:Uncharacterized protein n=1 Tax=Phaseolus coccineus TaxID=3886 RepID=A0AAN9MGD6_PHACN